MLLQIWIKLKVAALEPYATHTNTQSHAHTLTPRKNNIFSQISN